MYLYFFFVFFFYLFFSLTQRFISGILSDKSLQEDDFSDLLSTVISQINSSVKQLYDG